jgi:hypothetical protein
MKRLLDDDAPGPNKRNTRDVEITRLLPEHVDQIASYSLGALVHMAQTQTWWLELIQKDKGKLIVEHAEWHPWMRDLVRARFAKAQQASPALELPLDGPGPVMIPWPLLVQNWVRWNDWLLAQPELMRDAMHATEEAKAWTTEFELFDWRLLERAGTVKGRAFITTLFFDMRRMLAANDVADDWMVDGGPVLSYLALLEIALRMHSKEAGDARPASLLLSFLDDAMDFLDSFDAHIEDARAEAILKSLRRYLPEFFLTADVNDAILSVIYNLDDYVTVLAEQLQLRNPLGAALDLARVIPNFITRKMCKRIGQFAAVRLGWGDDENQEQITRDYVLWPSARMLFGGIWTEYWAQISGVLHERTKEQGL